MCAAASPRRWRIGATTCAATTAPAVATGFPFLRRRGPLALIGVSTSVPSLPFLAIGRVGSRSIARLETILDGCAPRRALSRRPDPPSADQQALALSQAAHRRRAAARRARTSRRRARDPRPQPSPPDGLARRTRTDAFRRSACRRRRKRRPASTIPPATISIASMASAAPGAARSSRAASPATRIVELERTALRG